MKIQIGLACKSVPGTEYMYLCTEYIPTAYRRAGNKSIPSHDPKGEHT